MAETRVLAGLPRPRLALAPAEDQLDWSAFKSRFVEEGRVIDTGNGGISHSEGQGAAMLFAVAYNDREVFDLLWSWTQSTLGRPHDALHAWRYQPELRPSVTDWSNATDGDILIAAALARAAGRWEDPAHATAARAITAAIIAQLIRQAGGRTILLPGLRGFEQQELTIINLSYYVYPLLAELAVLTPSPHWAPLISDGLELTEQAGFGRWNLPPDWLAIDSRTGALTPAPGWPARFAYDAIRVPLYMAWGGCLSARLAARFEAFWRSEAGLSAWVDLRSGVSASFPANAGMRAIGALVTGARLAPSMARVAAARDYYSASLLLLARLAKREAPFMA